MNKINIPCSDEIKVQSSLDFYLGITSLGEIHSIQELRKSFFQRFMSEYKEANYPLVNTEDYKRVQDKEEQEVEEASPKAANNFLQALQHMRSTQPVEEKEDEEDEAESYFYGSEEEEEESEEGNSDDTENTFNEESSEVNEDPEDIVNEEPSEEVLETQDSGYVSHGIYLEDMLDGTYEIQPLGYNTNEEEEKDEEDNWSSDYSEDEVEEEDTDWLQEDESEEEEDIDWLQEDDGGTDEGEDTDWLQEDDGDTDEGEDTDWLQEDETEEDTDWLADEDDNEEDSDYSGIEVVEPSEKGEVEYSDEEWFLDEPSKDTNAIVSNPVKKEVSIEDDGRGADVPSDVRMFLKQHPNSDLSYVLKFYPKKEIDKQLKLGRIYKRRGKLFI